MLLQFLLVLVLNLCDAKYFGIEGDLYSNVTTNWTGPWWYQVVNSAGCADSVSMKEQGSQVRGTWMNGNVAGKQAWQVTLQGDNSAIGNGTVFNGSTRCGQVSVTLQRVSPHYIVMNWATFSSPPGGACGRFNVPAFTRVLIRDLSNYLCSNTANSKVITSATEPGDEDGTGNSLTKFRSEALENSKERGVGFKPEYFSLGPWWGLYGGDHGCVSPVKVILNLFNVSQEVIFSTGPYSGLMSLSENDLWPVGNGIWWMMSNGQPTACGGTKLSFDSGPQNDQSNYVITTWRAFSSPSCQFHGATVPFYRQQVQC